MANKQPFKGVENSYTDALLYANACKVDSLPKEPDSENEADIEPKPIRVRMGARRVCIRRIGPT